MFISGDGVGSFSTLFPQCKIRVPLTRKKKKERQRTSTAECEFLFVALNFRDWVTSNRAVNCAVLQCGSRSGKIACPRFDPLTLYPSHFEMPYRGQQQCGIIYVVLHPISQLVHPQSETVQTPVRLQGRDRQCSISLMV